MNFIMLLIFGAIGGIARFAFATNGIDILLANIIGAMGLGFISQIARPNNNFAVRFRESISAGLLGSFTTFSAFVSESVKLSSVHVWLAGVYMLGTIVGGVCFTRLGMRLAEFTKHGVTATTQRPSAAYQTKQQHAFETEQG